MDFPTILIVGAIFIIAIVAVVVIIRTRNKNKLERYTKELNDLISNTNPAVNYGPTKYDDTILCGVPFLKNKDPQIELLSKQLYISIDNFWSWTKNDELYEKFKNLKQVITFSIEEKLYDIEKMPFSSEEKGIMQSFAMLQGLALSYYLVMDINILLNSYDEDDVTKALLEIFVESNYIGENAPISLNIIDTLIADKQLIIEKLKQKLPN